MPITVSRAAVRAFRAVLRATLDGRGRLGPEPLVEAQAGPEGLVLQANTDEVALRYHEPGAQPPAALAFASRHLADLAGRADTAVLLEETSPDQAEARWQEAGVPQRHAFDVVPPPEGDARFPGLPSVMSPADDGFVPALAEAARTAARDGTRRALTRVQLRGAAGEVVATDGKQLLVQRGFSLPWDDDVLVPALTALTLRPLALDGPATLGRTSTHVALQVGSWAFLLRRDTVSRFPKVDDVIPKPSAATARLQLDPADAAFLARALPRLPGASDDLAPVTLELGPSPCLRARAGEDGLVTELALARSLATGPPLRFCLDRRYLRRALMLGLTAWEVGRPDAPLCARNARRAYVVMPLDRRAAIPPTPGAFRVTPPDDNTPSPSVPSPRRSLMPTHSTHSNGRPAPETSTEPSESSPDLDAVVSEVEALRGSLQEAVGRLGRLALSLKRLRRQGKAVQTALSTLRSLRLGP